MNRGGYRGGPRGQGGRGFHGAPTSSFQPNGRYEGPPSDGGGGGWGPRGAPRGPPSSSRGVGPPSSNRGWGRDEVPVASWYRGKGGPPGGGGPPRGGGPRGPSRGAPRGGPRGPGSYGRRRGRGDGGERCINEEQDEYNREDLVPMREAPPPQKHGPPPFCQNFAFYGECRFGNRCRYMHALECVGYKAEAHGGQAIRCCVANPAAAEIFTAGKDKKLMRWQVCQGSSTVGDVDSSGEALLELRLLSCTDIASEVVCLKLLEGALFAGLADGSIKAFLANGSVMDLKGHEKSVYSLLLVEGVLISADWGGLICFWKYEKETETFIKAHALHTNGSISCMQTADIAAAQGAPQGVQQGGPPGAPENAANPPSPTPQTKKVLWAGGTALCIIDLQQLQVLRVLDISDVKGNGPPLVLSLLPFNDFLLVGFASGAITAYTAEGERQYCFSSDYLSAMEGLMSPLGPVLVFGGRHSSLKVLKVPEFVEEGSLSAHEEGDIRSICALGSSHFISCADDGAVALWKWADTETLQQKKP